MEPFEAFFSYLSDVLSDSLLFETDRGKYGEKLTEQELKKANAVGFEGKILRNLYVPKNDGSLAEIDVVYICRKGIIVIESKNYSGWIFGNEKDSYWTATLPGGTKNRFYNPITQNKYHIKYLRDYLNCNDNGFPMFSVIAFSERCELKSIEIQSPNIYVLKRDKMNVVLHRIWNASDVLDERGIEALYEILKPLTIIDEATKQKHVDRIKETYGTNAQNNSYSGTTALEKMILKMFDIPVNTKTSASNKCPKCGAPLVLRKAQSGAYAGKQFWGCSAFPRCRYTRNA